MAVIALSQNDLINIFGDGNIATFPFTFNQFSPAVTVNVTFKVVNNRVIVKVPLIQGTLSASTP